MSEPLRHLLSVEDLNAERVTAVLDTAEAFFEVSRRQVRKVPTLRGKTVVNLFYEASTRTRMSFELAGKRLSADVVNLSSSSSSTKKGESLKDTCQTLGAMQPDVVVMRHSASGAAHYVASRVAFSVINAGDGTHQHPSQALLDAFTIRRTLGRLEGLTVTICGDVLHSRVARSNIQLLRKFGNEVRVVGPRTLVPPELSTLGARVFHRLEDAVEGAHVIMVLRLQRERMQGAFLPSLREYSRTFGVGPAVVDRARPEAIVMHPGPVNRGVEIEPELVESNRSMILDQVEAGIAVRMALLYMLAAPAADSSAQAPT